MTTIFLDKSGWGTQAKIVATIFACLSFFCLNIRVSHAQTVTNGGQQVAPRALLYVTNSTRSVVSLAEHVSASDIVSPQTYTSTPSGKLLGHPKQEILNIAKTAGADVMPLISNQNFSESGIDSFLRNPNAQNQLLESLIEEAQKNNYIGYQYDFEHIPSYDRDLYSTFVAKSAPVFHNANLQLSVAIAPIHSDDPTQFGPGSWQNWTGAFDYSAIGASADFVSVMAYDDSRSLGPTASLPWVTQVATYTLAHIPASKVSFGIPFYAWVVNDATGKRVSVVGYPALASILDGGKYISRGFSDELGVPWVTYRVRGKTLTAWYEDTQSFQAKIALIKNDKMEGYSAWALGLEDPTVWNYVLTMNEGTTQVAVQ